MSSERDAFVVYGEHGEMVCDLETGQVLVYRPEGSITLDYADIARFNIEAYEALFSRKIKVGEYIDIVHLSFWNTLGDYHHRTPMSTDPKPVDAAKQVTDYLRDEDQAMLDVAWQEAVDARKADPKPLDIREQLWKINGEEQAKDYKEDDKKLVALIETLLSGKEINDNFIRKLQDTIEERDHTGTRTVGQFLIMVSAFEVKLVSVDYDFGLHHWILTALQPVHEEKVIIHRINFPSQTWLNDDMQARHINNCLKAMGLHPTTGVCSKIEVLDFLGFGEVLCLNKGAKPNA